MDLTQHSVRVGVSGRRNSDRRDYKVLMNVAGDTTDYAIRPDELRATAKALAALLELDTTPDFVMGFAPGGIAIAVALALELDLPAVIAYKTRLDLPGELTFTEPIATNSTFYYYGAREGQTMVLVDDEVDGGDTMCNGVRALRSRGVRIAAVASAVEILHSARSAGREQLAGLGLDLKSVRTIDVDTAPRLAAAEPQTTEANRA